MPPLTKNSSAAKNEPAQANPASSRFFVPLRSANAPTTGRTNAEMIVVMVIAKK